jgi:hydroxymethylbilane synthase
VNAAEILIGTRGSALALVQARLVADAFEREGRTTRLVVVETEGDRRPADTAWGEGAFVAAIERALLRGQVDVAVHSAKDVPTGEDERLRVAAYLPRADPRDALVVRIHSSHRSLETLPPGSRVGTDSPRRVGFVRARRPDLRLHPLHGNIDTRLRRLDEGETDALILAAAGLDRIGRGDRIAERLDPEHVPPAPGQGAIAVEIRRDDARMLALVPAMDDPGTRRTVESERAFLAASGGGCRAPIGALATLQGDELELLAGYVSADGAEAILARRRGPGTAGEAIARALAAELAPRRATARSLSASPRRVLVTRTSEQAAPLIAALREAALEPVLVPTIAVELEPPGGDLDRAARLLDSYSWVVLTSANGAQAIVKASERVSGRLNAPRWAAIGAATRSLLESEGIAIQHQPVQPSTIAMAASLPLATGDRVLVVRGDLADGELARALRARGATVDEVVGYRTREAPESSRLLLRRALLEDPIDAVIFTSGSTVRGVVALAIAEGLDGTSIPAVCIGPETAAEAERAGFTVLAVSPHPDARVVAEATARALATSEQETR